MNNTQYMFIGGIFPKETEQKILQNSKGSVQNAANVLQWNLIQGFDYHLQSNFFILNAPFIGSFPKRYKKLYIKPYVFSHKDGAKDYNIGFCNLTVFKRYSIRHNLKKQIKKWVKEGNKKAVIAYAMTDSSVQSIAYAKKLLPSIKTYLIVPDLPQYMNTAKRSSVFYNFFKKIDWNSIRKKIKYVDCFVLLTKQMATYLNIDNYVVVEGIANNKFVSIEGSRKREKTIMYAGTLNYKYGIGDLLEAFKRISDKDYRLIICGSGEAEIEIRKEQQKDNRIEFMGLIPNIQVLTLLKEATVLVNPRKNTEEYTKYSFPSKIMEYMASGTPIIAYQLDGIPEEYAGYINYLEDDEIDTLAKTIIRICELPVERRKELGDKARKFVLEYKNAEVQTANILNFFKND